MNDSQLSLFSEQIDSNEIEHSLFRLENIYRAYRQCRRRKRNTINALSFEENLEENLLDLREELTHRTYRPGRFLVFMLKKPKCREVFAADFRDRIVHHLLVNHLEPSWERRFINDSYACRRGKGHHKAVDRLRSFTRKVTCNGSRKAEYLQLDIRGFFVSVNRRILYQRLAVTEHDPVILWLIRQILFTEPTNNCRFRNATQTDFEQLPSHKTLFKAKHDCGLPIGNLTSQFFANVYLDALDQFVKHQLRVHYYIRYCDDMVLLAENNAELKRWQDQIEIFLEKTLCLQLNERRKLKPVANGIDFLGYIVRPDYVLVRRRVAGALRERLVRAEETLYHLGMLHETNHSNPNKRNVYPWHWALLVKMYQWLNSYLAHFKKAAHWNLINAVRDRFQWLDEYFLWEKDKIVYRCPIPRNTLRFSHQKAWFMNRLPKHMLIIQMGHFCDFVVPDTAEDIKEIWSIFPKHFNQSYLSRIKPGLWKHHFPVAWIGETGRRLSRIAERALIFRWDCL